MNQQLQKLDTPTRCGLSGMSPCGQPAHWAVLNSAQGPQVEVIGLNTDEELTSLVVLAPGDFQQGEKQG